MMGDSVGNCLDPFALVVLLAGACTNVSPPTPPVDSAPTGTSLFCAFGGVGTTPDPLPPGFETNFAVIVIELQNSGPPINGVTVLDASMLDEAGAAIASLRRVDHFVVLTQLEAPGPTLGIFAVYLNPDGTPFTGSLPTGRTQLRVRFSLDHGPSGMPARCRVELGGIGSSPLVIEGTVDGSWPT
jgi:hypothetical protein